MSERTGTVARAKARTARVRARVQARVRGFRIVQMPRAVAAADLRRALAGR